MVIHRHPALQQLGTGGECVSWTKDLRNYQICSSEKKTYEGQRNFRGEAGREVWDEVQKDAISEGLGGGFLRPFSGGSE